MPGFDARSQKVILSLEGIKEYLWCLPLPFLAGLDMGYGISILGAAYYGAIAERAGLRIPALIASVIGLIFVGAPSLRWKYGTLLLLITVEQWITEVRFPMLSRWHKNLIHVVLLFLTVLLLSFTRIIKEYSLTLLLLEAVLLYGFESMYYQVIRKEEGKGRLIQQSLVIGSFLAAGSMIHLGGIVLSEAALCFLAMSVTEREGAEGGLILTMPAAGLMRLTGTGSEGLLIWCLLLVLAVELFRRGCRWQMAVSAGSISLIYLVIFMNQSFWAGVLTLILSLSAFWLWSFRKGGRTVQKKVESENREIQKYMRHQLERSSAAFQKLGQLMPDITVRNRLSESDTAYLMENVAGRVCRDCGKREECWSIRFARTHEAIQQIFTASGGKGWIAEKDLPSEFQRVCPRLPEFVRMVNRHYELYRLNLSWENRMGKSRRLVRRQYEIMASCLERTKDYLLTELHEQREMQKKAENFLYSQDPEIRNVQVLTDQREDRVFLSFHHAHSLDQFTERKCREGLSKIIGRPLGLSGSWSERNGYWCSRYQDLNQIWVDSCGLRQETGKISGDNYLIEPLDECRYIMALSDGMGTGPAAGEESMQALKILEQLLLTGAEEKEALEMLHTSLVLGAREENFTTLDMALINLHNGKMQLVKAGGAVTYLCRGRRVDVCRSTSLPVGMLEEEAVPEIFEYVLEPEDRIVIISDGVIDQVEDPRQGEEWIRRYLIRTRAETAEKMAEEIQKGLREQTRQTGIEDDKTILTAIIKAEKCREKKK